MGFGILLFGYLMLFTVGPQINETLNVGFDFFPDILGCILFYIALKKLSPYSKKFFISKYIVLTMSVPSILTLFSQVMIFFKNKPNFYYNIYETAEYIKYPIQFVFHVFLFLGIIELSKDVGIKSIVLRSIISLIISSFYFVAGMYLIFTQNVIFSNQIYNIIGFIFQLLFYIMMFWNLFLIFSCYRNIIYEEDDVGNIDTKPLYNIFKRKNK